jgi:undecaprenyl-diphosphatase
MRTLNNLIRGVWHPVHVSMTGSRRRGRRLEWQEVRWLLLGLGACVFLFVFVRLASEVMEGETRAFDESILKVLRDPVNPSKPRGPGWVEFALLDLTALGGSTVLGLVTLAIVGFLCLQARYRTALVIALASVTGELTSVALKNLFMRPRPTIVPYLRDVMSTSFPSGHAMQSAIVYLTLGALLMRIAKRRVTKLYCLTVAVVLTLLVGMSRVYLGVHYPTDVIGGWMFGFMWASLCWLVAQRLDPAPASANGRDES